MAEVNAQTKELLQKHKLTKSDVWFMKNAKKWAITHKAMEKIALREKILIVDLEISYVDLTLNACVVKCTAVKDGIKVITFGECTPKNSFNSYPVAMAEKRALDRAILKLAGLHGDFHSEDEMDLRKQQEDRRDSPNKNGAKNKGDAPGASGLPQAIQERMNNGN
tara:strand:+ start:3165 stop:3659 length:495 start_codon:yes stop_codon:yes gene_type:complete